MLKVYLDEYLNNHSSFSLDESFLKKLTESLSDDLNKKNISLSNNAIKLRDLFWRVKFDSVVPFLLKNNRAKDSEISIFQSIFKTILEQPDSDEFAFLHCDFDDMLYAEFYFCYFDSFTHFSFDLIPYKNISNFYIHPSCFSQGKTKEEIVSEFLLEAFYVPSEESKLNLISIYKENLNNEVDFDSEDDFEDSLDSELQDENVLNLFASYVKETDDKLFENKVYNIKDSFNSFSYSELRQHFLDWTINYSNSVLKEKKISFLEKHFSYNYFKIKQTLNKVDFDSKLLIYPEFESDFFLTREVNNNSDFSCILNGDAVLHYLSGSFIDEIGVFKPIDFCSLLILSVGCEDFTLHNKRLEFDYDFFLLLKKKHDMFLCLKNLNKVISSDFCLSNLTINEIEFLLLSISDFYIPPNKSKYEPSLY